MYNMLGTTVNAIAIILGTLIGALLKKGMPKHISTSMTTAVAMIVLYIGIDGVSAGSNTMVLVFSVIIGGLLGTLLELDARLQRLGEKVEEKLTKGKRNERISHQTATKNYCNYEKNRL